jgi:hypothetical protein
MRITQNIERQALFRATLRDYGFILRQLRAQAPL